jgi:hypothetical protein
MSGNTSVLLILLREAYTSEANKQNNLANYKRHIT